MEKELEALKLERRGLEAHQEQVESWWRHIGQWSATVVQHEVIVIFSIHTLIQSVMRLAVKLKLKGGRDFLYLIYLFISFFWGGGWTPFNFTKEMHVFFAVTFYFGSKA